MISGGEKSYIVRWESSSHEGKHEYLFLMRATPGEVWMAIDQVGSPVHSQIRVIPTSKARGLVFYQHQNSEERENVFELESCLGTPDMLWGTPDMLWDESELVDLPDKPDWYVPYRG